MKMPIDWLHPSNWPWVVYVWAVMAASGGIRPAWLWFRRHRAETWPVADGRVESVRVYKPGFSLTTRQGHFVADISYTYFAQGSSYKGRHRREFPTEWEAEGFVQGLQGSAITIRNDAAKPQRSALLDADLDAVVERHLTATPLVPPPAVKSFPDWLRPFGRILVWLAGLGFLVSLSVHLGAVIGRQIAPSAFLWLLHLGAILIWFPAVLVAKRVVGNVSRKDLWKLLLQDLPLVIRYAMYGFLGYAIVSSLLSTGDISSRSEGGGTPVSEWRAFSMTWMAFYGFAFAILYGAWQREKLMGESGTRR